MKKIARMLTYGTVIFTAFTNPITIDAPVQAAQVTLNGEPVGFLSVSPSQRPIVISQFANTVNVTIGGAVLLDFILENGNYEAGAILTLNNLLVDSESQSYQISNGPVSDFFAASLSYTTRLGAGQYTARLLGGIVNPLVERTVSFTVEQTPLSIPEPLTLSGSVVALGFGWWMKRKQVATALLHETKQGHTNPK